MNHCDIQALLCARICHDLSGVAGAVATGIELLTETLHQNKIENNEDDNVINFMTLAANGTVARIRFLRLALGPFSASHPADSIRKITKEYLATLGNGQVGLEWFNTEEKIEGDKAKILANMIMISGDSLSTDGKIKIEINRNGMKVSVVGSKVTLPHRIIELLKGNFQEASTIETPKEAQAFLLYSLLDKQRIEILPLPDSLPQKERISLEIQWHDKGG